VKFKFKGQDYMIGLVSLISSDTWMTYKFVMNRRCVTNQLSFGPYDEGQGHRPMKVKVTD